MGSLLKIATNGITWKLARFVVNSFNPNDMKMHLPKGVVEITEHLVHDLLGLPMGGELLYCIEHCAADLPALVEWKAQFSKAIIRPSDLEEKIAKSADSGVLFNMNFILLYINTLCELNKNGSCKTNALPHLLSVVQTKDINWCAYVVNCLKVSKTTWDDKDKDDYFCGPLLVLLLAYLQFMRNLKTAPRQTPTLHLWDLGTMIQRERAEIKHGEFGTLDWEDEDMQSDNEPQTDEIKALQLNELVSKVNQEYKKLLNDKIKIGKLIEFSTTKFNENEELKEIKRLFEEEFNQKSEKVVEDKGTQTDEPENKRVGDEDERDQTNEYENKRDGDEDKGYQMNEDENKKDEYKGDQMDEDECKADKSGENQSERDNSNMDEPKGNDDEMHMVNPDEKLTNEEDEMHMFLFKRLSLLFKDIKWFLWLSILFIKYQHELKIFIILQIEKKNSISLALCLG
ncbi:hypothetical protein LXL04_010636 [Taraxacum kok-saghyz]